MWDHIRRRFTLVEFVVMTAVIAFLSGLLFVAVQKCFTTAAHVKSSAIASARPLFFKASR